MSHDHNSAGAAHGNTKQYTIGFILSVILTIIPFGMVMAGGFGRGLLVTVIAITAVAQILVQLIYFLHMITHPRAKIFCTLAKQSMKNFLKESNSMKRKVNHLKKRE